MAVIEARHLSKTFYIPKKEAGAAGALKGLFSGAKTEVHAVKDVSFEISEGEFVGFLGPNGAGKTTTLKMLTGILVSTSGDASVLGYKSFDRSPDLLRQISLVMGNKAQLWWDLPARDGLRVLKELYDVSNADFESRLAELGEALQIGDKMDQQVRKMSLGERMKCELIAALLHQPKVIFLDEPTLGLDLVSQKRIREFLRRLNREEGTTIILTSHYMQDVQELCERIIIIDQGALKYDGSLEKLTSTYTENRRIRLQISESVDPSPLSEFGTIIENVEGSVVLEVPRGKTAEAAAKALALFQVADIAIDEVPIEDIIRSVFAESAEALNSSS